MNPENHIISDNQRRAVATTLALLDEMLCHVEQWCKGREEHGVLYDEQNLLSTKQQRHILLEIARMRKVLEQLRDTLRLAKQVQSAANDIWGKSAASRDSLMELVGGKLRGYGEVSPAVRGLLGEKVPLLIRGLDRITSLAIGTKPSEQGSK